MCVCVFWCVCGCVCVQIVERETTASFSTAGGIACVQPVISLQFNVPCLRCFTSMLESSSTNSGYATHTHCQNVYAVFLSILGSVFVSCLVVLVPMHVGVCESMRCRPLAHQTPRHTHAKNKRAHFDSLQVVGGH